MKSKIVLVLIACLASSRLAAQGWDGILPRDGIACFGRDYDAAHLARNANQKIERLRLVIYNSIASDKGDYPFAWMHVVVAYASRGTSAEAWERGSCDAGPDAPESSIACAMSCYGAQPAFKMAREGADGVRLDFGAEGAGFCRADRPLGKPGDATFVLRRLPARQCGLLQK